MSSSALEIRSPPSLQRSALIPIRRPSCHCYSARAPSAAGYRPADPLSFPGCPSILGTPDMDPQGSKMKEDSENYRSSYKIKGIIELLSGMPRGAKSLAPQLKSWLVR
jgi:hypothetical protein